MWTVIVLLDTTVFGADPTCAGNAWQVLALAAPTWGIRLAVTEVVVTEAVANYQREVETARAGLAGWAKKSHRLGVPGLDDAFNHAERALSAGAADYAERLKEILKASGVEILRVARVPHMQIVARATARRRPCDHKGDGYRDTLNWLTLLARAKAKPEEQVVWVSNNTADFGSGNEDGHVVLHPNLIEDLDSISARGRVSWELSLADVVLALAAKHAPGSESGIKQVQEKVRSASVLEFLATELLPSAVQQPVSPRQCALPVETISAKLRSLENMRKLELVVKGLVIDGRAVAEFTVSVDAGIDAALSYPSDASGMDTVTTTRFINKPLLLRGLVTLGRFEKPIGAELAAIESLPDDPDRSQWQGLHLEQQVEPEAVRQVGRWLDANQEAIRQAAEVARLLNASQESIHLATEAMQLARPVAIQPGLRG